MYYPIGIVPISTPDAHYLRFAYVYFHDTPSSGVQSKTFDEIEFDWTLITQQSIRAKMFTEVDVFIGNNTLVDPAIYQHWLDGLTGTNIR